MITKEEWLASIQLEEDPDTIRTCPVGCEHVEWCPCGRPACVEHKEDAERCDEFGTVQHIACHEDCDPCNRRSSEEHWAELMDDMIRDEGP